MVDLVDQHCKRLRENSLQGLGDRAGNLQQAPRDRESGARERSRTASELCTFGAFR